MQKLQVGIIGFGDWGERHLEAYRALPFVEVAAVCDANPARREAALRLGVPRACASAEELLSLQDIQLVSVVTYERNHLEPTLLALQTGKHVIVEKPVTTDPDEAEQMLAAAAKTSAWIAPGHLLRFEPKYAEIQHRIRNNRIGQVASIYLKRSRRRSLYTIYKRTHTVYELMIHDIDLAIWYAGSRVRQVYASGCFLSGAEAPEVLWANLIFENGVVAVLNSNWMTPDESGIVIHDYTEVIGDKGIARFETDAAGLQWFGAEGRCSLDMSVHHNQDGRVIGALKDQLDYLCQCALTGKKPEVASFEDAAHGIRVARAIVQSAVSGTPVTLA